NSPTPTTTSATTTTISAPSGGVTTTTTGLPRPPSNYTAPPPGNFSSLATMISSFVAGRSATPGFSPTPKAGSGTDSGASALAGSSEWMMGLVLTTVTAVLAAAGTLTF
ncbi:hypothetical protein BGW38_009224, partial [Lunasporangiospora selenospora]